MTSGRDVDVIRFHASWLKAARAEGEEFGPKLLALPVANWREEMNAEPRLRSYGTLAFLLDAIHGDLQEHPARAFERIVVVREYVDAASAPTPSFLIWLSGVAWREYANALRLTNNPKAAVDAAAHARMIFDAAPGFGFEAGKAQLVQAQAARMVGDFDVAYRLARCAAASFREYQEHAYYEMARITEAWILFGRGQYREALSIFSETANDAERRGDKRGLAICLHDAAECARALGDEEHGRDLSTRAVELLNKVGNATDAPRVRWAHALDIAKLGRVREGVSELFKVRAEFLALGMNTDAAVASLDVVRLKLQLNDEVTTLCAELVRTFSEAGMTAHAIEALAYLREEAKRGSITTQKIDHVRTHIRETARMPALLFAPPIDEDYER